MKIANYFSEEITKNNEGGAQTVSKTAFHLIPTIALFRVAAVLHEGCEKYGERNWDKIPIPIHLSRAIQHLYAFISGDRTEDHLSHALCRVFFAAEMYYESQVEKE